MFQMRRLKFLFFLKLLLIYPSLCISEASHTLSDQRLQQINIALDLFEKAIQLSPELIPTSHSSLSPYYKRGRNNITIEGALWDLTKTWMSVYLEEIKKDCQCNLTTEDLLGQPQIYRATNQLLKKGIEGIDHNIEKATQIGTQITAKYGKTAAGLKIGSEVAETVISFGLGMKGVHIICNLFDLMIFPISRKIQKYGSLLFSYGPTLSSNSLLFTAKMAWISRRLKKLQKTVFFDINQVLHFNQEELEKLNAQGPSSSLFNKKGHRLLWLENLKAKTDPFWLKITNLEKQLESPFLSQADKKNIEKKILSNKKKIQQISKLNRKDFFGNRFKRYFFLTSRKGRKAYMDGEDLKQSHFIYTTIKPFRNHFWPLAPIFLIENVLDKEKIEIHTSHPSWLTKDSPTLHTQTDDIILTLVNEFLNELNQEKLKEKQESISFFISDFHKIFDTTQETNSRIISAYAVEILLSQFFSYYLQIAKKKWLHSYPLSYKEKIQLYWNMGQVERLAYEFTNFLTAVAITKKPEKINFYKYESIEKFFSFLLYFDKISRNLKEIGNYKESLDQLKTASYKIQTYSLTKEKNSIIQIPFIKRKAKCHDIVRRY
ncbi:MAG: hypothetical protein GDA46_02950 [Bdellovibrionales bacterium]|nr:hypothetical protein [Bdellovibrionales bacterium]